MSTIRLQKVLAEAGVSSRRGGERMILDGHVRVNGKVVLELGTKVDLAVDSVEVDGKKLKPKRKLYVALNKPRGCICSRNDPEGRPSVYEFLPVEWTDLYTVGRLDYNSEGLLLLTNDGDFCLKLTHPRFGMRKKYLATVKRALTPEFVKVLSRGVEHEGEFLKPASVRLLESKAEASVVEIELGEGKNREIRRIFEAHGLFVDRLLRVQIGPMKLGTLKTAKWRVLAAAEVQSMLKWTPAREAKRKPAAPAARSRSSGH